MKHNKTDKTVKTAKAVLDPMLTPFWKAAELVQNAKAALYDVYKEIAEALGKSVKSAKNRAEVSAHIRTDYRTRWGKDGTNAPITPGTLAMYLSTFGTLYGYPTSKAGNRTSSKGRGKGNGRGRTKAGGTSTATPPEAGDAVSQVKIDLTGENWQAAVTKGIVSLVRLAGKPNREDLARAIVAGWEQGTSKNPAVTLTYTANVGVVRKIA
jgi:hypothetical protein